MYLGTSKDSGRGPGCQAIAYVQEELTLVWLLLITTVLTSFFIQRYQVQFIPPSGAAMILGMVCGGIVKVAGNARMLPLISLSAYLALYP